MAEGLPLKKRLALVWVPWAFKLWFHLVGLTCKVTWIGKEQVEALNAQGQNFIYAMWHNNVASANYLLRNHGLVVMISQSFDGQMVGRVLELFNNQYEAGSTSKGGARALLQMVRRVKAGQLGVMTPDGPRGPRYVLQPGCISLAQKSGCPLVPFHVGYTNPRRFERSWDGHQLPRMGSEMIVRLGSPYYVPAELKKDEIERVLQEFSALMKDNATACEAEAETRRKQQGPQ